MNVVQVEGVQKLSSARFFREFHGKAPVVVINGITKCRGFERWTVRYMQKKFGRKKLTLSTSRSGMFDYDRSSPYGPTRISKVTFKKAAELISKPRNHKHYVQQFPISLVAPEVFKEMEVPWIIKRDNVIVANLWFGSDGVISPLHYDMADNFLALIQGRKKVLLAKPSASRYLAADRRGMLPNMSNLDPENPAHGLGLKKVTFFEANLEPGDLLYIPSYWWHYVASRGVSMAVNYWWTSRNRGERL